MVEDEDIAPASKDSPEGELMYADVRFGNITMEGQTAVIAFGKFDGKIKAAAGETVEEAVAGLFKAGMPKIEKVMMGGNTPFAFADLDREYKDGEHDGHRTSIPTHPLSPELGDDDPPTH